MRVGETNLNLGKDLMVISKWNNPMDIQVTFNDEKNTKAQTTYDAFLKGLVTKDSSYVGKEIVDAMGNKARIVEELSYPRNVKKYTICYEDTGDIVTNLALEDITARKFNPQISNLFIKPEKRNLALVREMTYENTIYLLNKYRRCVVIRPCGFGKTTMALRLFKEYIKDGKNVLFLHYEKDDLNAHEAAKIPGVKIMTFAKLRTLRKKEIEEMDFDLVFIDEVHLVGGDECGNGAAQTFVAVKALMEKHPKTHFLGATATPIRLDGIDVISTLFNGHTCFPYTLEDALEDGLLKAPHYFYCVYNVVEKIRTQMGNIEKKLTMVKNELGLELNISEDEIEEINAEHMDKNIREICHRVFGNKKYLRFIAFYRTMDGEKGINQNKEKVLDWFRKAYPTYQVESLVVTSRTDKDLRDVDALPTKPDKGYEGRIDIVFNCEMLVGGYHSEHISGLILDRETQSISKYYQMLGRILSCESKDPVVVFDIFDNYHNDWTINYNTNNSSEIAIKPKFDALSSFEDLVNAYPNAIHWEKVTRERDMSPFEILEEIKEARAKRKTNKWLRNMEEINAQKVENNNTQSSVNIQSPITSEEVEKAVYEKAAKENLNFLETVELLNENMKKASAINESLGFEKISEEPNLGPIVSPKAKEQFDHKAYPVKTAKKNVPVKEIKTDITKETDISDEGFSTWLNYYNADTKRIFSKHIIVENRIVDGKDIVDKLDKKIDEILIQQIIKKWRTFSFCNNVNYTSYSDVDEKSKAWKMLKSISRHVYNITPEQVLRYMIEGKI